MSDATCRHHLSHKPFGAMRRDAFPRFHRTDIASLSKRNMHGLATPAFIIEGGAKCHFPAIFHAT
jgi:hypothetical protein